MTDSEIPVALRAKLRKRKKESSLHFTSYIASQKRAKGDEWAQKRAISRFTMGIPGENMPKVGKYVEKPQHESGKRLSFNSCNRFMRREGGGGL